MWRAVALFAAPKQARFQWETGASRSCGMAAARVGVDAGVGFGTGVNSWERV